jgi:hypothetical protein
MTRCSASSSEKPRSRNTLPLDGVTFSLLLAGIGPSPIHEGAQAILGELQIVFRRLPRALLEGVQHIHGFGKRRDVEDAVFEARLNADLADAGADRRHRFPVVRIEPLLHTSELEARIPPRIGGEGAQGSEGATEPRNGLIRHVSIYKLLYITSNGLPVRTIVPMGDPSSKAVTATLAGSAKRIQTDRGPMTIVQVRACRAPRRLPVVARPRVSRPQHR